MAFLNPFLLLGLAGVASPIIIHLLNRQKVKQVRWAAMQYLRTVVQKNQRRMNIEDILLLLLRCLLLILVALAFARPALRSASAVPTGGGGPTQAVIAIDNSYSMSATDGESTRLEQARQAAEQVLDALAPGSSTAVFLVSDVVNKVVAVPTYDLNLARKAVRESQLSSRPTNLLPAVKDSIETLKAQAGMAKEIYFITDGQAAGWKQMDQIRQQLEEVKDEMRARIILVGSPQEQNLGVSELRLASTLPFLNQPLRFEAAVINTGRAEVSNVRVALQLDDAEAPVDEGVIETLQPGETRSVSMFLKLRDEGYHTVTARVSPDRLPADDARTMAVRGAKELGVLLVDGDRGEEARDSETYFLRNAFVPVGPEAVADFPIKVKIISPPELEQAALDDYQAVVLANIVDLSPGTLQALERYLRKGGGLIVFPGDKTNVSFFNAEMFERNQFLPAALGPALGDASQKDKSKTLQDSDYAHPIVSIWNDPASGSLATARFFRTFGLVPPKKRTNEAAQPVTEAGVPRVVLNFADGEPAVMERTWGAGRVILFSSTADTAWNDLPVRPAFVALMHRALGSLVQRRDDQLNVRVGEEARILVDPDLVGKDATIVKPAPPPTGAIKDGPATVKEVRRIEIEDGLPTLRFDATDLSGAYAVEVGRENPVRLCFAAQSDPVESRLDDLPPDALAPIKNLVQVVRWDRGRRLKDELEHERTGSEIWRALAMCALALAAIEMVAADRFSRPK